MSRSPCCALSANLRHAPVRGWCNRQHGRFWPCYWGFESSPPSFLSEVEAQVSGVWPLSQTTTRLSWSPFAVQEEGLYNLIRSFASLPVKATPAPAHDAVVTTSDRGSPDRRP